MLPITFVSETVVGKIESGALRGFCEKQEMQSYIVVVCFACVKDL